MKVIFAPDWRSGVPYQRLLAEALETEGVEIDSLRHYRRVLPLARGMFGRRGDLLHLHWPEAYYSRRHDGLDFLRRLRFSTDLTLATLTRPLVLTAHNLHAHNRGHEPLEYRNYRFAMRHARAVIAHSDSAKSELQRHFGLNPKRCHVIPHGDLSVALNRVETPKTEGKLCLLFGTVEPYKGIEDLLLLWREGAPPEARLAIVGKPISAEYAREIELAAARCPRVELHLQWLSDEQLARWLSLADCVIFNYRAIFTSGAATLARSWGIPLLFPTRLTTIDLHQPSDRVFRFDAANFATQLQAALRIPADFQAAADWRERCSWPAIAKATKAVYASVIR